MREERRLALLRRQHLIAEVARKQALRGLAEALDTETRHAALAQRARALVTASAPAPGVTTGAAMRARAGFAAGLGEVARHAADAARDAARQSAWQRDTLVQAEARARRLAERTDEARKTLAAAKARREAARAPTPVLARKLHSRSQD